MARRVGSFKDDFFDKIALIRSPSSMSSNGSRSSSPKSKNRHRSGSPKRTGSPTSDLADDNPLKDLESHVKQVRGLEPKSRSKNAQFLKYCFQYSVSPLEPLLLTLVQLRSSRSLACVSHTLYDFTSEYELPYRLPSACSESRSNCAQVERPYLLALCVKNAVHQRSTLNMPNHHTERDLFIMFSTPYAALHDPSQFRSTIRRLLCVSLVYMGQPQFFGTVFYGARISYGDIKMKTHSVRKFYSPKMVMTLNRRRVQFWCRWKIQWRNQLSFSGGPGRTKINGENVHIIQKKQTPPPQIF